VRKTLLTATVLLASSGATAVGAATIGDPFYGADELLDLVRQSIANSVSTGTPPFPVSLGPSQSNAYVGQGSSTGQNAMATAVTANATQQVAPMSSPLTACAAFGGGSNGTAMNNGTGIVLGLDAVDIIASVEVGASPPCSGTPGNNSDGQTGLSFNDATSGGAVFQGNSQVNWKWALALLYGGLDYRTGVVDCNQASRRILVNNWVYLFQNAGCTNTSDRGGLCADTAHVQGGDGTNVPLWHAFRPDDASGTADVFAQLLGINSFVSTSDAAVNGFGSSPYCNALNWDTNLENSNNGDVSGTRCQLGGHDQWVGPGGIVDPQSTWTFNGFGNPESPGAPGTGNHRRPPPGVWGDSPDPNSNHVSSADVLPTSHQDNDPIRRPCLGTAAGNLSAENVCNLDGKLGVVLSIPASDFITDPVLNGTGTAGVQYPTVACDNSFLLAAAPVVYNCAPFNINNASPSKHSGQCENGDLLSGASNQCYVPINVANDTSACLAKKSTVTVVTKNPNLPVPDGRVYNMHMRDGGTTDGSIAYWHQKIPEPGGSISRDFTGGIGRIHSHSVVYGGGGGTPPAGVVACQMPAAMDEIGCIVQADPCSVGVASNGSTVWNTHPNSAGTNPSGSVTAAIRVSGMFPNTSTVQALGSCTGNCGAAPATHQPQYPMATKLYLNSAIGFQNVSITPSDPSAVGELQLAHYMSDPTGANTGVTTPINTVLVSEGFFTTGALGPNGNDAQFCEDYNQDMVCNGGGSLSQDNACARNPAGIVGASGSTICGNGVLDPFEECDDGPTQSSSCTTACRCKGRLWFSHFGSTTASRCN
jgi:hypothetical protein